SHPAVLTFEQGRLPLEPCRKPRSGWRGHAADGRSMAMRAVKRDVVVEQAGLRRDIVVEKEKYVAACRGDGRVPRRRGPTLRLSDDAQRESTPQRGEHVDGAVGGAVDGDHRLERRPPLAVPLELAEQAPQALASVV